MRNRLLKHPYTFILLLCLLLGGAASLPFVSASCRGQQAENSPDETRAYERLRQLTRGGVRPPEQVVADMVREHEGTRAGALALVLQARMRMEARDYARAAELLRDDSVQERTAIGDHALWLRADALGKLGRRAEERAALERLARDYPDSLRAREATLRVARILMDEGQSSGVPLALKKLAEADDAEALLLTGRAYERNDEPTRALGAYRRLYFYAPVSAVNDREAEAAFSRLGSTSAPATAEEAVARAERLFHAKRFPESADAFTQAFARFPETQTHASLLSRGVALFNAGRGAEAVSALNAVPPSAGDARAEALNHIARAYARSRQWQQARSTLDEMRRAFPRNPLTMSALVAVGQAAKDAKNISEALHHFRQAVSAFPGEPEVAGAQFELAWAAHEANNFAESSRLLIEHLADYADRNTDNRGRAGYWAARDSERAGRLGEAYALYEGMLARYDANWYGYLAKDRLEDMRKRGVKPTAFTNDSKVARAVANLAPVSVAEETAGPKEAARLVKAEQLSASGADDLGHAELDHALKSAPDSPRLNLAKAQLHRARNENVQAFLALRRSFPDYSQMKPEELTPDEWDVFYPLAYWDIIVAESRARALDPYTVAGLIRQESVFNPRAASHANAYGLMQLLVPTAQLTAKRYNVSDSIITKETLFEPRLNIRLGTSYLRQNIDRFGRIEYVAAAYNAGPGRAVAWRESLPLQIDEWAEAIPFRETRNYVQGVVRNTLQYRRLYDEQGRFRPEVGTRAVRRDISAAPPQGKTSETQSSNRTRPRRVSKGEDN